MKKVPVQQIENGMIAARDVCATSGNILIGAGAKLSAALGQRLRNWGVAFVYVEGESDSEEPDACAHIPTEDFRRHLEAKFEHVLSNPIMHSLLEAVYTFRIRNGYRINRDLL